MGKGPGVPKCSVCGEFFGHTEGLCSVCARGEGGPYRSPSEIRAEEWARIAMKPDELSRWVETGVHSACHGSCVVCTADRDLVTNFCCNCPAITCAECNAALKQCPYCRAGKYRRVSSAEVRGLLTAAFAPAECIKIARSAVREGYALPFKFEQLVCSAADIDAVVAELRWEDESARAHCNELNSIYCLAADFWTLQAKGAGFVLCYKDFGMESHPKTYRDINSVRRMMDFFNVMDVVVSDS